MRFMLPLAVIAMCSAADWPRFRGPNGTGISADPCVPIIWKDEQILWKTHIPGHGNSSPIVSQGRVFLQSASADGAERSVLCLSSSDGRIVWQRSIPGHAAKAHKLNSLASSTPAADGNRVYFAIWDGSQVSLHAFSFEGELLWKQDLGRFTSQHGPGTSVMVHDGRVYFANDQDGAATLYAFDAATGKIQWKADRKPFRASYSTPFILEREGRPAELIAASTAGISSYIPQTGKENWNWPWTFKADPLRCVALPQFGNGLLFVCAGDGDGRRAAAAVCIDVDKPVAAWQSEKRTFPYVPSPLIHDKHLYFVTDKGIAYCLNLDTGDTVWTERLSSSDFFASPILIDEQIFCIGDDGVCHVFAASPTFKHLGRSALGERVKATPAVSDGKLFIRGESHMYCIGNP